MQVKWSHAVGGLNVVAKSQQKCLVQVRWLSLNFVWKKSHKNSIDISMDDSLVWTQVWG